MMAGLNAAGVNVLDLEIASMPVTRYLVRSPRATGGLSIRLIPNDPDSVLARFFDTDGADIAEDSQRKIERLFQREDYRRVLPEEIGEIWFPARALEDYSVALEATVDIEAIAARRFKLVIDYSYGTTSHVMPNVLAKLGADVLAANPYASTRGVIEGDVARSAAGVAALVRASGAHLGAVIGPDGERLHLIDDEGVVLSHDEALLSFIDLVADHLLGDTIALPVNVTSHAEAIAGRPRGARPATKLSAPRSWTPPPSRASASRPTERGLHPSRVPARLRRRRRPPQDARPPRAHGTQAVRTCARRCRVYTSTTRRS